MHKFAVLAVAGAMVAGGAVEAEAQTLGSGNSVIPQSAFFGGAGVGVSFVNFGTQSVFNLGLSNAYVNGVLVAQGKADGPPVQTAFKGYNAFVPQLQAGYFHSLPVQDWFLGVKVAYNYVGASSSINNLNIPQYGSSSAGGGSFNGYSVTNLYKVSLQNQVLIPAFIGRQFGNVLVYAGGGASISQKHAELDGVVGYATISGQTVAISGAPQSVSSTSWGLGAVGTAGFMVFFTPHVFLDVNYTYSGTPRQTAHVVSPFVNPGNGVDSTSGLLVGAYTKNLDSQLVTAALNWAF